MKIIIIGAGIAGLTLGLACQRAGIEVKIFDKARELRTIGGGILLWPHGLRFLEDLGLTTCLRPAWKSVTAMNIIGHRGQPILAENHADLYSLLNGEILPIDRSQLQQLLLAELNDHVLHLNSACAGVESTADQARVTLADGSVHEADLVVGADGIHSVVRSSLFPDAVAEYSGFCWWGGIVEQQVVPHFSHDEVHFIIGQGKMCYVWPVSNNRFMWYLPVKLPLAEFNHDFNHEHAAQLCAGWNDDVQRIISAPQNTQRFQVPIEELAPLPVCHRNRVVLIGDAACAFGPLLGQGANKAIEDAYLLATLLRTNTEMSSLLSRFDKLSFARHQRFFELERLSADALFHETTESLQYFESVLPSLNLVTMYQDMIPLVNQQACDELLLA